MKSTTWNRIRLNDSRLCNKVPLYSDFNGHVSFRIDGPSNPCLAPYYKKEIINIELKLF